MVRAKRDSRRERRFLCASLSPAARGTGKTLIATSLALAAANGLGPALLDADVASPTRRCSLHRSDGRPRGGATRQRMILHPAGAAPRCASTPFAVVPQQVVLFRASCHGCGVYVELPGAIREVPIGQIEAGRADDLPFAQGVLNVSEAMVARDPCPQGPRRRCWLG